MDSLCLCQLEAFYISQLVCIANPFTSHFGFERLQRYIAQETVNTDVGYHRHKHTMGFTQKSDVIGKNNKCQR